MKTIELHRRYDVGLHSLMTRIGDPARWTDDTTDTAAAPAEVEVSRPVADGLGLVVRAPLAGDALPDTVKRFLPAGASLVQSVSAAPFSPTDDTATVRIEAEVPGAPAQVSIVLELTAQGTATAARAITRISSDVPLFGSMVESALEPTIERILVDRLERFAAPDA